MELTVRLATRTDAGAIARVQVDAWRAGYRGFVPQSVLDGLDVDEHTRSWRTVLDIEGGLPILVVDAGADAGERVGGFCSLSTSRDRDRDPRRVAEMTALYVDPPLWGRGIGTALCEGALEACRQRGFEQLDLWVLEDNARARRFYEALGFRADEPAVETEIRGVQLRKVRYGRGVNA